MDAGDLVANFVAITNADEGVAMQMLEACAWNLEEAVNLHWATDGHGGAHSNDAAAGLAGIPLEDEVDRLYGDGGGPRYGMPTIARPVPDSGGSGSRRPAPPVDIFKDKDSQTPDGKSSAPVLSDLFKQPLGIMYKGDMNAAATVCQADNKWLMLNLQSSKEFDSHRLNRDTWAHEAVQAAVGGMFLFIQLQDSSPEGQQAANTYSLRKLPAILVLDPVTGAKLYERSGFIDAEHLLEDLVPFMDHGPKDPGAGELANQYMRRIGSGRMGASGNGTPGGGRSKPMTEDEELAMAIAMSMEGATGEGQQTGDFPMDMSQDLAAGASQQTQEAAATTQEAAPATAALTPEQVSQIQAEAAARLGEEPAASDPASCRVMLRMPNGERQQRRFKNTDTVQALRDFFISVDGEAAGGRGFTLALAGPGASALSDMSQGLKEAGAANALVTVSWEGSA